MPSIKLTDEQLALAVKVHGDIKDYGTTDVLTAITAALDQYRCDYILNPHHADAVQTIIVTAFKEIQSINAPNN